MNAKKIAASLPAGQYSALERARKSRGLNRSEALQQALTMWLGADTRDAAVRSYIDGYARQPEDAREAVAFAAAWACGVELEGW